MPKPSKKQSLLTPPNPTPASSEPPTGVTHESQSPPADQPADPLPADPGTVTVGIDQAMHSMGFGDAPKEEPAVTEQPAAENPVEGAPDAKEGHSDDPPEAPAEPKADKKEPAPAEPEEPENPELDLDALHQTVRDTVRDALKTEPAKSADQKAEPALSPSRRDTLETAKFMEGNMDAYRGTGLQEQLKRYWQAEDAYKAAWLKEHPGQRYKSDDEAHNDFYATNPMPDYSPDDFEDARTLRREQMDQERETRHREEIDRIKFEAEAKRTEEEIQSTTQKAVEELYVNASDNVKAALTIDGKIVINEATLEKLEVEEPVYAQKLREHAAIMGGMIHELQRLTRFPQHVKIDPNNPTHQHILNFADSIEQFLASRPKAETMRNGKTFLTQEDYMARSEQIRSSSAPLAAKKAQLKNLSTKFYFPDAEVIQEHLIKAVAKRARVEAEQIEARLAKSPKYARTATPQGATHTNANGTPPEKAKTSDSRDVRPPSPTVTSSDRTNAGAADPSKTRDRDAAIDAAMWQ